MRCGSNVAHGRERVAAGAGDLDLEALEAQRHRDDVGDVRLVVDDEDAVLLGAGGRGVHADIVGMNAGRLLRGAGAAAGRYGQSICAASSAGPSSISALRSMGS